MPAPASQAPLFPTRSGGMVDLENLRCMQKLAHAVGARIEPRAQDHELRRCSCQFETDKRVDVARPGLVVEVHPGHQPVVHFLHQWPNAGQQCHAVPPTDQFIGKIVRVADRRVLFERPGGTRETHQFRGGLDLLVHRFTFRP